MQDYELAARLRDDLAALAKALEKQAVVFGDATDADVIALAEDPLEVAVKVVHVDERDQGQRGWVADQVEDVDSGGLVADFLLQLYAGPMRTRCPGDPRAPSAEDVDTLESLLCELRGAKQRSRCPSAATRKILP
ncbi:MAG: hypothetical protein U0R21_08410 [Nocardioidaceae bacterium]